MTKSQVAFGVWLLVWLLVLFVGVRLYLGVIAQKVPGYPKDAQLEVYVFFPAIFVVANAILIAWSRKLPFAIRLPALVLQVLVLPAFIFFSSGGV